MKIDSNRPLSASEILMLLDALHTAEASGGDPVVSCGACGQAWAVSALPAAWDIRDGLPCGCGPVRHR